MALRCWGLVFSLSVPLPTPRRTPSSTGFQNHCPWLPGFSSSPAALPVPSFPYALGVLASRLRSCWGLAHLLFLPTRTLYKILDSCKQLTLAQGAGEEDPSGMVTIVTGLSLDNPSALSGPMQVGP